MFLSREQEIKLLILKKIRLISEEVEKTLIDVDNGLVLI